MGALGILLLQLYYNENSAFHRSSSVPVISPCDQTVVQSNCFFRTKNRAIHQESCYWFMPQPLKKKKCSRMRATNTTIATTDFMWNVLWIYSRRFELALQVLYSSGVRWLLRLAVVSHRDLTNKQSKLSAETCCRLEPAVCSSSSSQTGELQQAMRTRHGSNKHAQTHS